MIALFKRYVLHNFCVEAVVFAAGGVAYGS